jgi:CNT family concentrative nucleoside transporter
MNLISILGLIALLGMAWAMSYKRRDINFRTLAWGLGLQFLFALIILREDHWSFVGMAVFGLLLIAFILRSEDRASVSPRTALWMLGCLALGVAGTLDTVTPVLPWLLGIILILGLFDRPLGLSQQVGKICGALFVTLGVAYLISNDLHGQIIFAAFSDKVASFLNLSDYGAAFLFGNLADPQHFFPGENAGWPGFGFLFAFKVLPTIVFFGGFMSVLYYLGIMQRVILAMSRFMRWTIGTSGAETLSCSANIFVGQTEAPLLIKPFLEKMTRSELLTIMVGGFATIAGGVLAGYIAMGVPAGHLIAASVMSAPAALVIGKLIFPETENSATAGEVLEMPEIDTGTNVIEAASNGITDGLKLAVNVGAMLLGFIALIAVLDVLLNWMDSIIDGRLLQGTHYAYTSTGLSPAVGEFAGYFPGSLQTLFGTLLSPLAWLMGVPWADASKVGNLLGIKLSLNEFVAYGTLGNYIQTDALSPRGVIISTYALCGFANFSSIGIQIGGISAVAPSRKSDLAQLGLKAMFGGAIASWLTATIAGILIA